MTNRWKWRKLPEHEIKNSWLITIWNKTAKSLKEIAGIDVFSDKEQTKVKSMTQILDELNGKWDTLSDKEQKALSYWIAPLYGNI